LQEKAIAAVSFNDFLRDQPPKAVILRHDVDKLPSNSLLFAELEHKRGFRSTYYFRSVPASFDSEIIKKISLLGHEIGYHYEDMDLANGDVDQAYSSFRKNLAQLRELVPVNTVCMHGSPLSRHDNRDMWKKYDYSKDGIIGEPYFDLDFSKLFYLTDTGRKWNNSDASIRDKVDSPFKIEIKNTAHLIKLIREERQPDLIMINTHPQRWHDNIFLWIKERLWQNSKNLVKKVINKKRNKDLS